MKVQNWDTKRPISPWLPAGYTREYVSDNYYQLGKPIVDIDECNACGLCIIACPEGAISKYEGHVVIDYEDCRGCGLCVEPCPRDIISLIQENL